MLRFLAQVGQAGGTQKVWKCERDEGSPRPSPHWDAGHRTLLTSDLCGYGPNSSSLAPCAPSSGGPIDSSALLCGHGTGCPACPGLSLCPSPSSRSHPRPGNLNLSPSQLRCPLLQEARQGWVLGGPPHLSPRGSPVHLCPVAWQRSSPGSSRRCVPNAQQFPGHSSCSVNACGPKPD